MQSWTLCVRTLRNSVDAERRGRHSHGGPLRITHKSQVISGIQHNSFPRSAWECRPGRSASPRARPDRTTRSVEEGIPTEDRGNEGFAVSRVSELWVVHSVEHGNEFDSWPLLGSLRGITDIRGLCDDWVAGAMSSTLRSHYHQKDRYILPYPPNISPTQPHIVILSK